MRARDIRALLRFRRPSPTLRSNALNRALSVADLRRTARRRLPRGVFDYVEGGAEDERSIAANRAAFETCRFVPIPLVDVGKVDTSTTLLGASARLPLVLAPTGYTRLMHPDGEIAAAAAARDAGLPYTLSTMGTTSIEEVATVGGELWFQLYVWRDRGLTRELVDRAERAGYQVLMVTVDTAVPSRRERDMRNGFTVPPTLGPRSLVDLGLHPGWWTRLLRGAPLTFANVTQGQVQDPAGVMEFVGGQFDPTVTWDDIERLRERWPGRLLLKGVVSAAAATRAADMGLDGVVLSNHGGRQLDYMAAPMDVLPELAAATRGRLELLVDSGVRRGSDIAKAIALGARGCLVGRPYLYGLAAGGQRGVARVIDLFADQFERTLQLLGITSVAELAERGSELVRRQPLE